MLSWNGIDKTVGEAVYLYHDMAAPAGMQQVLTIIQKCPPRITTKNGRSRPRWNAEPNTRILYVFLLVKEQLKKLFLLFPEF